MFADIFSDGHLEPLVDILEGSHLTETLLHPDFLTLISRSSLCKGLGSLSSLEILNLQAGREIVCFRNREKLRELPI